MDTLAVRREKLCLKFAKDCVRHEKLHDMFPKNRKLHLMDMRQNYEFVVKKARTERLQRSAVLNMQKLLNKDALEKKEIMRQLNDIVPVNYDCMQSTSL